MAQPIEHRDTQSVMNAYEYFDKPNFAVFHVKDMRAYYDGGNKEQGTGKLQEWLDMIEASNTGAVYTLKVYDEMCRDIKNNTPHSGSTTFMLSSTTPVKTENGVTIIDRTQGAANAGGNAAVMARLDSLEKTNVELREKLHKEEMKSIETRFQNQIAGLQKNQDEENRKGPWDRIGEMIAEKPERLDKLIDKAGDIIGHLVRAVTGESKNFIQPQPVRAQVPVNGTNTAPPAPANTQDTKNSNMETATTVDQASQSNDAGEMPPVTEEGAYINPYLTDQEKGLKKKQQYDLLQQRLKAMDQEQLDNEQMRCVQVLESRMGSVTVTHLFMLLASLDNDDLNKVLNNMT